MDDISDDQHKDIVQYIRDIDAEKSEFDWILDTTEKWCKERAIISCSYGNLLRLQKAMMRKRAAGAIPSILSEALAVSFDNHIGHDYLEDYESDTNSIIRRKKRFLSI